MLKRCGPSSTICDGVTLTNVETRVCYTMFYLHHRALQLLTWKPSNKTCNVNLIWCVLCKCSYCTSRSFGMNTVGCIWFAETLSANILSWQHGGPVGPKLYDTSLATSVTMLPPTSLVPMSITLTSTRLRLRRHDSDRMTCRTAVTLSEEEAERGQDLWPVDEL